MGTQTIPTALRGIIVHDPAFSFDNLSATSTATQTSPYPGQPVQTVGTGQAELISTQITQTDAGTRYVFAQQDGGYLPGKAARVAWDDASTGASRRGHLSYNTITGFEWAITVASGYYWRPHAITLPTGRTILVYYRSVGDITARYRDPLTNAWTTVTVSTSIYIAASASNGAGPTIVRCDNTGRLICFYETIQSGGNVTLSQSYSDDDGETWTQGTENIPGFSESRADLGNSVKLRAVYHRTFITLIISSTVDILTHLVSSDLGGSFDAPAASTMGAGSAGFGADLIACPSGDVLLLFVENVGGIDPTLFCARKTSPYGGFGTAFVLDSSTTDGLGPDITSSIGHVACCVDTDGTLFAAYRLRDASGVGVTSSRYKLAHFAETIASRSDVIYDVNGVDSGTQREFLDLGATAAKLDYPTLAPHQGSLLLCANSTTGAGTMDGSIGALFLGGWSSITWLGTVAGFFNAVTRYGLAWLPITTPGAAWTATGSGGTLTVSATVDGMQFSNLAAAQRYFGRTGTATGKPVLAWARLKVTSGGSLAASDIFIRLHQGDGTNRYRVVLRFTSTGCRLHDINATATIGTDVTGLTADVFRDWVICLNQSNIDVYYRAVGDTKWSIGPTGVPTSTASVAASISEWGVDGANYDTTWKLFWSSMDGSAMPVTSNVIAAVASLRGRPVSTSPQWLDGGVGYAARGGPLVRGDAFTITQRYAYGTQNIDPMICPSPSVEWVSQSEAEQSFIWITTAARKMLSSSIGVALIKPRFRLAYLERWNGAAYVVVATIDAAAGMSSLTYDRVGDVITPNASTAAGERALYSGDYRGGYILFDVMADQMRQIEDHSDGVWRGSGSRLVEMRISGDSTVLPSSGTCHIIAPSVACIVHDVTQSPLRWRLRIGVSSTDFPLALSKLVIGPFIAWGQQNSRGRTVSVEPIQRIEEDGIGRTRVEYLGQRREVEMQWTDLTPSHDQHAAALSPAYVSASSSYPGIAYTRDHRRLEALMSLARGASRPVVYVPSTVLSSGTYDTICGPDELLYGRIRSSTITRTAVLGNELDDESSTAGKILIREEL